MAVPIDLRRHAEELAAATGLEIDLIEEGPHIVVLLHKVSLPSGLFKVGVTDMLFITDQQYPCSAMDMFWTEPEVVRPDGSVPTSADVIQSYIDRSWRRFSWHRNNVWSPKGNPLMDHYAFMESRWPRGA